MKTVEMPGCPFVSGIDTIYESDPDDENLSNFDNSGLRERRRKLHTEAEQRRRNAIKKGFDRLVELLSPVKNRPSSTVRMNKSIILHKSISKVQKLMKLRDQKIEEYEFLNRNFQALNAFYSNYEKIAQEESEVAPTESIPEEIKLRVFQLFADHLFSSFEPTTTVASYDAFCRSVIEWLEENCKPERLSPLMDSVLACTFNTSLSRSQGFDCSSSTCKLRDSLEGSRQTPHLASFMGPEWLDEKETCENMGISTNLRPMVLGDRLTGGFSGSEAGTDQQSIHRPCSMEFVPSNQCLGDMHPSFGESNSSPSIGTHLSSSELLGHVPFQSNFSLPNNPPTTDSTTAPVTPRNSLHCMLSRPSGNVSQHSTSELQFRSDEVGLSGSNFLLQNFNTSCNDTPRNHRFYPNHSSSQACIPAPPSSLGSMRNDSFDHPYPLQYL